LFLTKIRKNSHLRFLEEYFFLEIRRHLEEVHREGDVTPPPPRLQKVAF